MNWIVAIPFSVRMGILALAGAALGSLVNYGVYAFAWHARAIGPWLSPPEARRRAARATSCRSSAGSACARSDASRGGLLAAADAG